MMESEHMAKQGQGRARKAIKQRAKNELAPSTDEQRAIVGAMCRTRDRAAPAQVAIRSQDGAVQIDAPHDDAVGWQSRLQDTFASRSGDFADTCVAWLANAAAERDKPLSQATVNAALAVVAAAAPSNELEALLAVQMFASHDLSMEMMRRAKQSGDLRAMTEYGTLATKLSRTMTTQIEAMGKLRRGGEQTVRVEHVHVYEGGQAVVGVVNQGGAHGKAIERGHGPNTTAALGPALLGEDPTRHRMPIPSDPGKAPVPHPRRRERKRRPAGK